MTRLSVNKNRRGISDFRLDYGTGKGSLVYSNSVDNDPQKIAQVLIDLHFQGMKISEAIKIFIKRINKPDDWIGI